MERRPDGRLRARPLRQALAALDAVWDGMFDFAGKAACVGEGSGEGGGGDKSAAALGAAPPPGWLIGAGASLRSASGRGGARLQASLAAVAENSAEDSAAPEPRPASCSSLAAASQAQGQFAVMEEEGQVPACSCEQGAGPAAAATPAECQEGLEACPAATEELPCEPGANDGPLPAPADDEAEEALALLPSASSSSSLEYPAAPYVSLRSPACLEGTSPAALVRSPSAKRRLAQLRALESLRRQRLLQEAEGAACPPTSQRLASTAAAAVASSAHDAAWDSEVAGTAGWGAELGSSASGATAPGSLGRRQRVLGSPDRAAAVRVAVYMGGRRSPAGGRHTRPYPSP